MKLRFALALLLFPAASAMAAQPAPVVPVAGMIKMFLVLLIVLGMLFGLAWLLRRYAVQQKLPGGGALRVIAGTAVGQRERVVLVEVGETWLVVGVAPGQVSALHTMPKVEMAEIDDMPVSDKGFSAWLKQVVERRNAGS